jgi:hypothetical protein
MGRHTGPDGLPARGDQAVLQPAREQGISAGRRSSSARAAPDDTAYGRLDFFTAPDRGHVPAARDALEAAARRQGWATERMHDSDTFCRLVIRSDTAEVVTDLAVDTPPDFPPLPPLPGPRWLPRNSPGASCSRYSTGPRHGTSPTYDYSPGASARMFCWPAPHRSTRALISGPWPA